MMRKIKDKNYEDLVLDLIYTSEVYKNQMVDYVRVLDVAKFIARNNGSWSSYIRDYKEKFKGIKEGDVTNSKFKESLEAVTELVKSLELKIKNELVSFRKSKAEKNQSYKVKFMQTDNEKVNKLIEDVFHQQGKKKEETILLDEIPKQIRGTILKILDDLTNSLAKQNVMEEAFEMALLHGNYNPLEEFKTVSKACKAFVERYKGDFDLNTASQMDELKEWISTDVQIVKKDAPFYDETAINKSINSWKDYELKKFN